MAIALLAALSAAPKLLAQTTEVTAPCRMPGWANEVRCGVARRPLDPARPGGAQLDIHYVVVRALARRRLPDPVFMLAGGPGQSAIALAPAVLPLFARLNKRRDIVFVDQRGTGRKDRDRPGGPPPIDDKGRKGGGRRRNDDDGGDW